ncbi:MAG: electron transfer flavoprotein subunit alpha/FixB family protein [Bacteroidota bacterium]|jgi:electron transfer flavoprotein alpha subunit|nr:electron transfer flavoprotein subunit alpha/FixB family protein [Bacteroidota bacterium]
MSVLVYTEIAKGKIKKASLEAVNYASRIAEKMNTTVTAAIIGDADFSDLGKAGAKKVLKLKNDKLSDMNGQYLTAAIEQAATAENASVIIFSSDFTGKEIAPRLAARLKAGIVAGAVGDPEISGDSFKVKKNVFSGKATAMYAIHSTKKIISLLPNSFPVTLGEGTAEVTDFAVNLDNVNSPVKVKEVKKVTSELNLTDAELVVSAGRGMKGSENWAMVEELAKELGAATACSRPVADMHWRPHHEHVGQTGVAIRPNLYIAIGISGAIQHLAGVNGSKTIVVINSDKEAPFFKSADYGIVGDAFEIVPKLVAAVKNFKANHN